MKTNFLLFILLGSLLASATFAQNKPTPASQLQGRVIRGDFNKPKGTLNTMFKECVGAGRANEGLRADWQQQLTYIKKTCGFKYIRMHGLLTDDMGVYKEDKDGNPGYNFQYIDVLYDYLQGIGMKPFVELGLMPSALASGEKTIFWWKGNVTPPKDYNKWGELVKNLVLHFTERYGAEEVKTWYFEVWNEPNLKNFWDGTREEYFKLYEYTAKAVKSINPLYRVGGPATSHVQWVPEMISFCNENQLPLDFISTHSYGIKKGYLDEKGNKCTILNGDPMSVSGDILKVHTQIKNSPMPNLGLHITEWSSSYTPSDPVHDSYHQAAYVLEKIKQVGGVANSMSYWTFTDIFEEVGPRFTPFHGGFGLLNYQGIKKPAFYSYQYLNRLGSTELINADPRSWACKNEKGDIQVLLWDFTNTHPGDSVSDQEYYVRNLPSKSKGEVTVSLSNIPEGCYALEISKVGYHVNDPFTSYLEMGKPKQLTRPQAETIRKFNDGTPVYTEIIKVDAKGTFTKILDLRENDVFLLCLVKL